MILESALSIVRTLAHPASALGAVLLLASNIHLVERRGKKEKLDPKRQVDISTLLESIPEAAVIVDNEGHIVDVNSVAGQLVGKTREELRGADAEVFARYMEPPEAKAREHIVLRALAGHPVRHERRVLRHPESGINSDLLISANPMLDDQGHVIAALLIARDVTELTQLQRRIGDIERHRAIGQMAAALAHDFNNILDTIGQAAAVLELKADQPANERKALLKMIQNTVHRGAEMVQRIREYLRTGAGAMRLINVCEVIEESVELTRPLWQKSDIKVTLDLKTAPEVTANAADLRRVFTNLIINAIEAMPKSGEISLTCASHNNQVVATISDNGIGIPLGEQKKIFYAYYTTKPRGTGLGLSGAQKIVLSYGGNISFRSEPGKGTTFTVILPAAGGKIAAA